MFRIVKHSFNKPSARFRLPNTKRFFTTNSHPGLRTFFRSRNGILIASVIAGGGVSLLTQFSNQGDVLTDSSIQITPEELMKHNSIDDCWVAIHGKVYDLTKFIREHPGGAARIMKFAGKDGTPGFHQVHSTDVIFNNIENSRCLGTLSEPLEAEWLAEEQIAEETQEAKLKIVEEIKQEDAPFKKPPLAHIFSLTDFETVASKVLPTSTYGYYATGACDEHTLNQNSKAYSRIYYKPRMLRDVEEVDISTKMLGCVSDAPIYITAFAGSRLAHPDAELNLSRGAFKEGIIEMVPTQCSIPIDDFLLKSGPGQEQWYQVHFYGDQHLSEEIPAIKRANELEHIKAICINVDLAALGHRERDEKIRVADDPEGILSQFTSLDEKRPSLTWKHFENFRRQTDLPIILKGVQSAEDVVLAAENNIDAVILSNHGGRQLDFSRPPVEVLAECRPLLKEKGLEDKIEIYVDGGIRRGSDVIKALCLGAKGVGLGRPFLFAMSSYGEEGVSRVIQILKSEMIRDMKLLGAKNLSELNESFLEISDLKRRQLGSNL